MLFKKSFYNSMHLGNTNSSVSLQGGREWTLEIRMLKSPAVKNKNTCFTFVTPDRSRPKEGSQLTSRQNNQRPAELYWVLFTAYWSLFPDTSLTAGVSTKTSICGVNLVTAPVSSEWHILLLMRPLQIANAWKSSGASPSRSEGVWDVRRLVKA